MNIEILTRQYNGACKQVNAAVAEMKGKSGGALDAAEREFREAVSEAERCKVNLERAEELEGVAKQFTPHPISGGDSRDGTSSRVFRSDESIQAAYSRDLDGPRSLGSIVRDLAVGPQRRSVLSIGSGQPAEAVSGYITGGIIDAARRQSVLTSLGAQFKVVDNPLYKAARIATEAAPAIYAEAAGRSISAGAMTFAPVELPAYSSFILYKVSLEAMDDVESLDEALRRSMSRQMALEFDRYGLYGDGTGEPLGVGRMTNALHGVNEITSAGAFGGYGKITDGLVEVLSSNYQANGVVMPSAYFGWCAAATDTTDQPLRKPEEVGKLAFGVSDYLPSDGGVGTNESTLVVGDWSRMMLTQYGQLVIDVGHGDDGMSTGHVYVRGWYRWSAAVIDPAAFCVISGALAPAP